MHTSLPLVARACQVDDAAMLKEVDDYFNDFDSKEDTLGVIDEQRAMLVSFETPGSGRRGGKGILRAGLRQCGGGSAPRSMGQHLGRRPGTAEHEGDALGGA
jgi:hypothetical protein